MNCRTAMNSAAAMSTLSHHGERTRIENRLRFAIMAISGCCNSSRAPMAAAGLVEGLDCIGHGGSPRTRWNEARRIPDSEQSFQAVRLHFAAKAPMAQYVYTMRRVGKVVPPKRFILKNISLNFFAGAKIGVLGLNGSGKSTLLRIMAGEDKDYDGEVVAKPNMRIGYLPQEPQLDADKSVREAVE